MRRSFLVAAAAAVVGGAACNDAADSLFCDDDHCDFSRGEWARVQGLTGLGDPPLDRSNGVLKNEDAIALGHRLYFDTELSGPATWLDTVGRTTLSARAPLGMPTGLACASCHDPSRAGADFTSSPGHVSVGAGWYDVNSQQTVNAAQYRLLYWNGRSDSLWGQAAAVMESDVSMNGNRLAIVWTVARKYRAEYEKLFPDHPLPPGKPSDLDGVVDAKTGQCVLVGGACPTDRGCREAADMNDASKKGCWPRFPLAGKPGRTAGCQPGSAEPAGDAFDCMDAADRTQVNFAYTSIAKAIGAYEWELDSKNSPFDRWVEEGPASATLSPAAKRGLKLFVGRASCVDCHDTPLLSDGKFHDVGVPQVGVGVPIEADCPKGNSRCDCQTPDKCLPWGAQDGLARLKTSAFRRDGVYSDDRSVSEEYAAAYQSDGARGAWRTPSLRDVALTAPYMHDGAFRTLEEVIWHYNDGGRASRPYAVGTPSARLKPLGLSAGEVADLVDFLRSLTGAALSQAAPP